MDREDSTWSVSGGCTESASFMGDPGESKIQRELFEAAASGELGAVRRLLATGVQPDQGSSVYGTTAMMQAALHGHTEVVRELLRSGASSTARNKFGETALDMATKNKHHETAQVLPGGSHNFDSVNEKGLPCIYCAKVVGKGRKGLWCAGCQCCKTCGFNEQCKVNSPARLRKKDSAKRRGSVGDARAVSASESSPGFVRRPSSLTSKLGGKLVRSLLGNESSHDSISAALHHQQQQPQQPLTLEFSPSSAGGADRPSEPLRNTGVSVSHGSGTAGATEAWTKEQRSGVPIARGGRPGKEEGDADVLSGAAAGGAADEGGVGGGGGGARAVERGGGADEEQGRSSDDAMHPSRSSTDDEAPTQVVDLSSTTPANVAAVAAAAAAREPAMVALRNELERSQRELQAERAQVRAARAKLSRLEAQMREDAKQIEQLRAEAAALRGANDRAEKELAALRLQASAQSFKTSDER